MVRKGAGEPPNLSSESMMTSCLETPSPMPLLLSSDVIQEGCDHSTDVDLALIKPLVNR